MGRTAEEEVSAAAGGGDSHGGRRRARQFAQLQEAKTGAVAGDVEACTVTGDGSSSVHGSQKRRRAWR